MAVNDPAKGMVSLPMGTIADSRQHVLAALLGGEGYGPHGSTEYVQQDIVPGTVDPWPPSDGVESTDALNVAQMATRLDEQRYWQHLLDCLADIQAGNPYEVKGPFTFGGPGTGTSQIANVSGVGSVYSIVNPFDTDAEWCCLGANFGGAGQAIISNDANPGTVAPALTSFYDSSTYIRGIPFFAAGIGFASAGSAYWFSIPASDSLYLSVNVAGSKSALATVVFRRRLDRHLRPIPIIKQTGR